MYLLVCEVLATLGLVRLRELTGIFPWCDSLFFGADCRDRWAIVVDLFDDVVGCGGDELTTRIVESLSPGTRKNRFIRDAVEAECVRKFWLLPECSVALARDLPIEKQANHPVERIGSWMPGGIPIVECVKWAVQ
ncbi:hypothetical protein NDI56_17245 [Haloarcula sp. S1CR25-12]|uniref:Uncharacterized protein n=1 Tax=Haloarcula saliterrae TaxID=2950534 RepID=A0ABU2FFV7_9EURY|nr:hypothetical protein [Haloarcula sp. S1CR25-12]MDS0261148.1 hypothetical protein [Haloarcula sp. S1CR25-12]